MRLRLAAGLVVVSGLSAGAVPPAVPFLPPEFIDKLPQPEPTITDPAKLAERIKANTKAAAGKLADRDPGLDARKAQQQALRDIEELLKQAENQPPPPMGGDGGGGSPPPPMGGGDSGGQPPPPSGGQSGQPGSKGQPKGGPPPGGNPPSGKGGSPQPGGPPPGPTAVPAQSGGKQPSGPPQPGKEPGQPGGPKQGGTEAGESPAGDGQRSSKPAMPLDDPIAKQVWGHLPDTVRKQMSQYYQEQFMPRYGGLLRDYFTALAEREKSGSSPPVSPKR